jgi:hypothetical protein
MQISTRVGAVQVIPGLPSFDRYQQDRSGAACVQRRTSVLSPSELSTQSEVRAAISSSPCGNRSCGRPAQQENEFSPLQFLELHLLAMVIQRGVCNNLAILASLSIPLTPRRLQVRHSGAFCINGIAQRPSLDAKELKSKIGPCIVCQL